MASADFGSSRLLGLVRLPNSHQLHFSYRLLFNRSGLIPPSLLRCDSDVGWVESFGVTQDRLRDTHHSERWVSALCASTHPTIHPKCVFFDTPLLAAEFFITIAEMMSTYMDGSAPL